MLGDSTRTRPAPAELERVAEEQAALLRIATLVAGGATEAELAASASIRHLQTIAW